MENYRKFWSSVCIVFLEAISIASAENFTIGDNWTNSSPLTPRDPAAQQLREYEKTQWSQSKTCISTSYGVPVDSQTATLTVGPRGPIVLQDANYIDVISNFDRERIPERVVHAKGAGAFGYFEVTHDISRFTKAVVFSKIGKRTSIAVRFSMVAGEMGSADTVRDVRGFALKFYTEEGIWDLVGNNWPVFFIRDPMLFASLIHTQKRNPTTHLKDADMFWDFVSLRPETTYQTMLRFTDGGIPDGYRHIDGHGIHTFKLVNARSEQFWCKFHYLPEQGYKNLTVAKALELAANDPDYATRDLYNSIQRGDYPSWTFYVQIMPYYNAATYRYNPFDPTKEWPESDYPYLPVGKMVFNKNPSNYFADVEQIAFAPSRMIPGIEPSPDKLLQGRLFSYPDTQVHRLGANYLQLPINNPFHVQRTNYERDGPQTYEHQDGAPNYYPNSFGGPNACPQYRISSYDVRGVVDRYDSDNENNFEQPRILWKSRLNDEERSRLVDNIANSLSQASDFIQQRQLQNFAQVSPDLAARLRDGLNKAKQNPSPPIPANI